MSSGNHSRLAGLLALISLSRHYFTRLEYTDVGIKDLDASYLRKVRLSYLKSNMLNLHLRLVNGPLKVPIVRSRQNGLPLHIGSPIAA